MPATDWQLPQRELPGRPKLSDARLYRRRERVFAVLAALFVVASAMLPLLGVGRVYGVSRFARQLGIETVLLLPVGAVAMPIGLLAIALVCELYGVRRARALFSVAVIVWIGVLGLAYATDVIPDFDGGTTRAFGPGLACVGCCLATWFVHIELYAAFGRATRSRQLWLRNTVAVLFGAATGWVGFALLVHFVPLAALPALAGFTPDQQLAAVTLGAGAVVIVTTVVAGPLVLYALAGPLATYLRVARFGGTIEVFDMPEPAFAAGRSGQQRAFTTDEHEFFDEGDELANKPAADSAVELRRKR